MPLNTTATFVDTVFQQQDTDTNSFDNRQGSIGYSQALTWNRLFKYQRSI